MSLTSIARPFFMPRVKAIEKYANSAEQIQRRVLHRLLKRACRTEWGEKYGYAGMDDYEAFAAAVPVNTYEETKEYIDRMRHGEADVLWPGRVRWYAKSSGTTNDKSKFIPVSREGLQRIHYAGGRDAVALYLRNNPKSRICYFYGYLKNSFLQLTYYRNDYKICKLADFRFDCVMAICAHIKSIIMF